MLTSAPEDIHLRHREGPHRHRLFRRGQPLHRHDYAAHDDRLR